jgi:hypothetical protein
MVAARNSDYHYKCHDKTNRGHKDHNPVSQTESNARQDVDSG